MISFINKSIISDMTGFVRQADFVPADNHIAQSAAAASMRAVVYEKTKFGRCIRCKRQISKPKRGRRLFCADCGHYVKLQQTRAKARKYQGGLYPICALCGARLSRPGKTGGRPKKYCDNCLRKKRNLYEAEKKSRKLKEYK